ncbi:PqqD family protein [Spirosoma sp. KNUC1025]|uniref:PqqD family protein n=1 Tax=Spirosoma sp. KNUC1025 TaxID=2894082 RepID=UPI00386BDCC5|nr:PqqD family protein [Spirosoma sp. KNUC1025]
MNLIIDKTTFDIEDFDEEIVLVHTQTGIYYTVKGGGPAILRTFQNGLDAENLSSHVLNKFGSEKQIEAEGFVNQLISEGILISADTSTADVSGLADLEMVESPVIEKFDDISDLIKLDPIHDVSDLGWPHKK